MTTAEIKATQAAVGAVPDGFWGPRSIAATQRYLRALMPKYNQWPAASQSALSAFYGEPGDESRLVRINVAHLGVLYDGQPVTFIRVNNACAESLRCILLEIAAGPHKAILSRFAGVFENRPMRNGSTPSLHARGAAIDLAPETNGNHDHWPTVATMPLGVMESFARRGWIAAGAFWSRDAMHFQATR